MKASNTKKRCENWALEDKMLLQELVKERVKILENKNTDTNSNARKFKLQFSFDPIGLNSSNRSDSENNAVLLLLLDTPWEPSWRHIQQVAAWADLHNSFNIMRTGAPRTIPQLKNQWGSLKISEKRIKSLENKLRLKTGGGPPPIQDPTDANDISAWLPDEFVVDTNEFDSDSVNQALVFVEETAAAAALPGLPGAAGAGPSSTPPLRINENEITPDELEVPEVPQARRAPRATARGRKRKTHKPVAPVNVQPAANIAATEMKCRTELHQIQMENEQHRQRNLELKEQLLITKIAYFERKNNLLK